MPDSTLRRPIPAARLSGAVEAALRAGGVTPGRAEAYAPDFARLCAAAGLDTPLRLGHIIAQLVIESDRFKATEEYASGAAYELRKDLGNIHRGDGRTYKGRGLLQTTGRSNYRRLTHLIRGGFGGIGPDPDAPDFEQDPERVADRPYSILSALAYWHDADLASESDADTVTAVQRISRRVNRGSLSARKPANHEAERIAAYRAVMASLRRSAAQA